jgi:hypothetical protein
VRVVVLLAVALAVIVCKVRLGVKVLLGIKVAIMAVGVLRTFSPLPTCRMAKPRQ